MQNLQNIDLKDLFMLFANDNTISSVEAMSDKELESAINLAYICVAIEDADVEEMAVAFPTNDTLIARQRELEAEVTDKWAGEPF